MGGGPNPKTQARGQNEDHHSQEDSPQRRLVFNAAGYLVHGLKRIIFPALSRAWVEIQDILYWGRHIINGMAFVAWVWGCQAAPDVLNHEGPKTRLKRSYKVNRVSPVLGAGLLLLCGILLAWPIVTGGWLTYLDNPAHVAEIHSLAFDDGGGWSDIAWCGYPLGRLHSPVWFGWFAHLVRAGLALGPVYAFLVVLGFVTPPVVLFGLARRRVGSVAAVLLAWLVLVQKTSLVGFGSPLGGMWTFYLSCGIFLVLMERLSRRQDRTVDLFWIAGLYGILGLTHLFTLVPGVLVFGIHATGRLVRGENRRFLMAQVLAAGLGAAASAAYWAPLFLGGDGMAVISYNLPPMKLLARLLLGAPVSELVKPDANLLAGFSLATTLPQVLLVGAGVAGFFLRGKRTRDRLTAYGFTLAVILFAVLLVLGVFQMAGRDITWLGHVSWRMLFFVRLGLAVSALPLIGMLGEKLAGWENAAAYRGAVLSGAILLILMSLGLGGPLRSVVLDKDGSEMREIRQLWSWLEENKTPDWGRIYLQDPFGSIGPLGNSHVLALTRRETDIDQVGPLYAGSPFHTVPWLVGESRKLFGSPMRKAGDFTRMLGLIPAANTTRLILHWPDLAAEMVNKGYARYEYHSDNFAVLAMGDYPHSRWAEPLDRSVNVAAEKVNAGLWRVTTDATQTGGAALIKVSWSPHWKTTRSGDPLVDMHETGLIRLSGLPAGRHITMLEFSQPRWPDFVSIAGWGMWLILLAAWRLVPAFGTRLSVLEKGNH